MSHSARVLGGAACGTGMLHKGGFYHDGRFALVDVVEHYERFFKLRLSPQQKNDLIEYLKSIQVSARPMTPPTTHATAEASI